MWDDDDFQTYFEGHFEMWESLRSIGSSTSQLVHLQSNPMPLQRTPGSTSEVSLHRQSARSQARFLQKKSEHRLGMTCLEERGQYMPLSIFAWQAPWCG